MGVKFSRHGEPRFNVRGNGQARGARLGELLIQEGAASPEQVKNALRQQRRDHRPLGELLVQLGVPSAVAAEIDS